VVAGWDTWVDVSAGGDTYNNTLTNGATGQAVGTADTSGGHPGWANWGGSATHNYGASIDGTWGTVTNNPPTPTATGSTAAVGLLDKTPSGEMTFTITNTSGSTMELAGFHFDGVRVRTAAPQDWALSILTGSDATVGAVTNGTIITDTTSPFLDREDVDIDLTGLADRTLENGEVVIFELAWTGGSGGTPSGGNNTMIDNVALSGSILPVTEPPLLEYSLSGGDLVFNWTGAGWKLQTRTNLTEGSWSDVPAGAVSPVTVNPTNPAGFFRLTEQ
jgi:hypothetical protein